MKSRLKIVWVTTLLLTVCVPHPTKSSTQVDSCSGSATLDSLITVPGNPRVPNISLHLICRERETDYCYVITVQKIGAKDTIQSIVGSQAEEPEFSLTDINFDGYKDIMLCIEVSANGQTRKYSFWLFDSTTMKFNLERGLSDTLGANIEIDDRRKEVTTGGRGGCGGQCFEYRTYHWTGNKFLLVKRESVKMDPDDSSGQTLIYILENVVGDSLRVVRRELWNRKY